MTRKQRAKILLKRLNEGPSLSMRLDGLSQLAQEEVRRWLDSWILPEVKALIPELRDRGYYEIAATDVGKPTIEAFGRIWRVADFIGRIQKQDIGKRIYRLGGIVQVENEAQRAARLRMEKR